MAAGGGSASARGLTVAGALRAMGEGSRGEGPKDKGTTYGDGDERSAKKARSSEPQGAGSSPGAREAMHR